MPHGTLHCPPEIHKEQEKYDIIQIENVTPSTLKRHLLHQNQIIEISSKKFGPSGPEGHLNVKAPFFQFFTF